MAKKIIIVCGVIIVCLLVWYMLPRGSQTIPLTPVEQPVQTDKAATFTWSYAVAGEDTGIQKTAVTLTATYLDGTKSTKDIATVEGTCNDYANPDKDIYEHSTMIICYAAGFGDYFKVVATDHGYLVERKEFAEASPDYNPPEQPFKTVATF